MSSNETIGSGSANLRNIAIIAHIDHGKSTLADRFIQLCGGLSNREMRERVLDSMELERERGITIKAQCVTLSYAAINKGTYIFNFIDTPGHIDFSYEVSRSLNACEGAILLVDAAQGVEAQTLANTYAALEQGVEIVPVLNKIDLPQAEITRVEKEIESLIGLGDYIHISAKQGIGIKTLLETLILRIPAPAGKNESPLQALIIDSWFDSYMGVVSLVRVVEGCLRLGDKITVSSKGVSHRVENLGVFTPHRLSRQRLSVGEVGYVTAAIKDIHGAPVGDTLILDKNTPPLSGFRLMQPRIFAGIFPVASSQFPAFRAALTKLALNDAALVYVPIHSLALGAGFRVGLLGLLHLDVVRERLTREYDLDLIVTAPNVVYRAKLKNGSLITIESPAKMPVSGSYERLEEPMAEVTILSPRKYLGAVLGLCQERRGKHKILSHQGLQVFLEYRIPMSELITDFFDRLSSLTSGFASMDYRLSGYEAVQLVKVDILLNGEPIDALAQLIHKDNAVSLGRTSVENLQAIIPRQLFTVAIQAAIGGKIIARATVAPLRKDVTAKCYGGDVTRKRKLLDKQRKGKKRMKRVGKVDLPSGAFELLIKR